MMGDARLFIATICAILVSICSSDSLGVEETTQDEPARMATDSMVVETYKTEHPSTRSPESGEERFERYQLYQGVMGRPGVDYPVYSTIPVTSFSCKGVKKSGYYADLETNCQVFHICERNRKISFLCPNGTIFRQSHLICDWWFRVDCGKSTELYEESAEQLEANQKIYKARSDERNRRRKLNRPTRPNKGNVTSWQSLNPVHSTKLHSEQRQFGNFEPSTEQPSSRFSDSGRTATTTNFNNHRQSGRTLDRNHEGILAQQHSTIAPSDNGGGPKISFVDENRSNKYATLATIIVQDQHFENNAFENQQENIRGAESGSLVENLSNRNRNFAAVGSEEKIRSDGSRQRINSFDYHGNSRISKKLDIGSRDQNSHFSGTEKRTKQNGESASEESDTQRAKNLHLNYDNGGPTENFFETATNKINVGTSNEGKQYVDLENSNRNFNFRDESSNFDLAPDFYQTTTEESKSKNSNAVPTTGQSSNGTAKFEYDPSNQNEGQQSQFSNGDSIIPNPAYGATTDFNFDSHKSNENSEYSSQENVNIDLDTTNGPLQIVNNQYENGKTNFPAYDFAMNQNLQQNGKGSGASYPFNKLENSSRQPITNLHQNVKFNFNGNQQQNQQEELTYKQGTTKYDFATTQIPQRFNGNQQRNQQEEVTYKQGKTNYDFTTTQIPQREPERITSLYDNTNYEFNDDKQQNGQTKLSGETGTTGFDFITTQKPIQQEQITTTHGNGNFELKENKQQNGQSFDEKTTGNFDFMTTQKVRNEQVTNLFENENVEFNDYKQQNQRTEVPSKQGITNFYFTTTLKPQQQQTSNTHDNANNKGYNQQNVQTEAFSQTGTTNIDFTTTQKPENEQITNLYENVNVEFSDGKQATGQTEVFGETGTTNFDFTTTQKPRQQQQHNRNLAGETTGYDLSKNDGKNDRHSYGNSQSNHQNPTTIVGNQNFNVHYSTTYKTVPVSSESDEPKTTNFAHISTFKPFQNFNGGNQNVNVNGIYSASSQNGQRNDKIEASGEFSFGKTGNSGFVGNQVKSTVYTQSINEEETLKTTSFDSTLYKTEVSSYDSKRTHPAQETVPPGETQFTTYQSSTPSYEEAEKQLLSETASFGSSRGGKSYSGYQFDAFPKPNQVHANTKSGIHGTSRPLGEFIATRREPTTTEVFSTVTDYYQTTTYAPTNQNSGRVTFVSPSGTQTFKTGEQTTFRPFFETTTGYFYDSAGSRDTTSTPDKGIKVTEYPNFSTLKNNFQYTTNVDVSLQQLNINKGVLQRDDSSKISNEDLSSREGLSVPPSAGPNAVRTFATFYDTTNYKAEIPTNTYLPVGNQQDFVGTTTYSPISNQQDFVGTTTYSPISNQQDFVGTTTYSPISNQQDFVGTTTYLPNSNQQDFVGTTTYSPVSTQPDLSQTLSSFELKKKQVVKEVDELLQNSSVNVTENRIAHQEDKLPSSLTNNTQDSYLSLFPESGEKTETETTTASENENATGSGFDLGGTTNFGAFTEEPTLINSELTKNDLDGSQSRGLVEPDAQDESNSNQVTPSLRTLAQVFTKALSAYLDDPEGFKKVLSEIRPTEPAIESEVNASGGHEYPSATHEADEVLDFSDETNSSHKKKTSSGIRSSPIKTEPFTEGSMARGVSAGEITTESSAANRVSANEVTTQYFTESSNAEVTVSQGATKPFNSRVSEISNAVVEPAPRTPWATNIELTAPFLESLDESQSSYYTPPSFRSTTNTIAQEINRFIIRVTPSVPDLEEDRDSYFPATVSDSFSQKYGGFQNNSKQTTKYSPYGSELSSSPHPPIGLNIISSTPSEIEVTTADAVAGAGEDSYTSLFSRFGQNQARDNVHLSKDLSNFVLLQKFTTPRGIGRQSTRAASSLSSTAYLSTQNDLGLYVNTELESIKSVENIEIGRTGKSYKLETISEPEPNSKEIYSRQTSPLSTPKEVLITRSLDSEKAQTYLPTITDTDIKPTTFAPKKWVNFKSDSTFESTFEYDNSRTESTTQSFSGTTKSLERITELQETLMFDTSHPTLHQKDEARETVEEIMDTLNRTSSTANTLMKMMEMAAKNETYKRLVLLLVNDKFGKNKTAEESRVSLLRALLTPVIHPRRKISIVPITNASSPEPSTSGWSGNPRRSKSIRSEEISENNFKTASPTTFPTTLPTIETKNSNHNNKHLRRMKVRKVRVRGENEGKESESGNLEVIRRTIDNRSKSVKVKAGDEEAILNSDSRAVELLRSLYSLASRWG